LVIVICQPTIKLFLFQLISAICHCPSTLCLSLIEARTLNQKVDPHFRALRVIPSPYDLFVGRNRRPGSQHGVNEHLPLRVGIGDLQEMAAIFECFAAMLEIVMCQNSIRGRPRLNSFRQRRIKVGTLPLSAPARLPAQLVMGAARAYGYCSDGVPSD